MNKKVFTVLLLMVASVSFLQLNAQTDSIKKIPTYHVGIFAPLYLDSVFTDNSYRYSKQGLPKFIVPAVEFVQGAQIALDSMQTDNQNIDANIYDSKSYTKSIPFLIKNKKLDSLNLIIGSVKDADYKQLADFALLKNIPFISVTYPNDGGVVANPFTVIMNSTLKAHCEAIYSYLLQNHGTDAIFLCRQKGTQEDKVAAYFKALNEQDGKPLLPIKILNIDAEMNPDFLKSKLDSARQTVLIGGSLDENFATGLTNSSYDLFKSNYHITLIGMPNWYGFASLNKRDNFSGFPVYFTSPYYNEKKDAYSKTLISAYMKKYRIKPSDMAYKGFETVYMYTTLLAKYPGNFISHINDSTKVFCDYNIMPVMLKKDNTTPDYFENKHVYFIKLLNGNTSRAW